MHTPENPELEISQTVAEIEGELPEEDLIYSLSDTNIDDILNHFGPIKCSTLDLDFDGIIDLELGFSPENVSALEEVEGELPEDVSYMALRVRTEMIARGPVNELQVLLDAIPYQWPDEFKPLFPAQVSILLGTVDDNKLTPSVLNAVGTLNKKLENSILTFEKL